MRFHIQSFCFLLGSWAVLCTNVSYSSATDPIRSASSAEISLKDYLKQVSAHHKGLLGLESQIEGLKLKTGEASFLTKPTGFISAQWVEDRKNSGMAFALMEKTQIYTYSLGVSQLTPVGLSVKAAYELEYLNFVNPTTSGGVPMTIPSYFASTPKIEARFSLWQNFLGSSTQAQQRLIASQNAAQLLSYQLQRTQLLADAEVSYWKLVLLTGAKRIRAEIYSRALQLKQWSERRSRLHLGDETESLQANAVVKIRALELNKTEADLRASARVFNELRGEVGDILLEELEDSKKISELKIPEQPLTRLDVLVLEKQREMMTAQATLGVEKFKPDLELYAAYAFNGKKDQIGSAFSDSFGSNRPTTVVGVQFRAPLDVWTATDVKRGYAQERVGAEMAFEQKVHTSKTQWATLVDQWKESKLRLGLAQELEEIQLKKMNQEKAKLNSGRSTTHQYLFSEQDFANALLERIRIQSEVLELYAQAKLYESSPKSSSGDAP